MWMESIDKWTKETLTDCPSFLSGQETEKNQRFLQSLFLYNSYRKMKSDVCSVLLYEAERRTNGIETWIYRRVGHTYPAK